VLKVFMCWVQHLDLGFRVLVCRVYLVFRVQGSGFRFGCRGLELSTQGIGMCGFDGVGICCVTALQSDIAISSDICYITAK
jgi:hypothetical protein